MKSIVDTVLNIAEAKGAVKVLAIHLRIGELTFLNPGQLKFAFEVLSEGTIAQGASLTIERVGARVKCRECNYEGEVDRYVEEVHLPFIVPILTKCPKCGSSEVDLTAGRECTLASIRIQRSRNSEP